MKLTAQQIDDSHLLDSDVEGLELDETIIRTKVQRKELRSAKKREAGEIVGHDSHSYRKY